MSEDYKKLCFTCTEKSHADFKIRLIHDGLSQGALLRLLMYGYIQGDENVLTFVDSFREKYKIQRKTYIKKSSIYALINSSNHWRGNSKLCNVR